MTITYHTELIQGSDEWHKARCGLITASEVKLLLTPTLKQANNDKSRPHLWELAAQRISNYVEPSYIGDDMLRGHEEEFYARQTYAEHFAPVEECGFVTNDEWGFTIGCSPDGLVGTDGTIECKSRRQKYQIQTIVENWRDGTTPDDYTLQVQTVLMVTGRKWCDLISYSGGLPLWVCRCVPETEIQKTILEAAKSFNEQVNLVIENFSAQISKQKHQVKTEYINHKAKEKTWPAV